jgi:transposase-like protein
MAESAVAADLRDHLPGCHSCQGAGGWTHPEQSRLHAIGAHLDGNKDVLRIWIGENESNKFWLAVLNELKNPGVQDILIVSVENLTDFSEAIHASFPDTVIRKCIVHLIRNSVRYVSYKDLKKVTADLKPIYQGCKRVINGARLPDCIERIIL